MKNYVSWSWIMIVIQNHELMISNSRDFWYSPYILLQRTSLTKLVYNPLSLSSARDSEVCQWDPSLQRDASVRARHHLHPVRGAAQRPAWPQASHLPCPVRLPPARHHLPLQRRLVLRAQGWVSVAGVPAGPDGGRHLLLPGLVLLHGGHHHAGDQDAAALPPRLLHAHRVLYRCVHNSMSGLTWQ